MSEVIINTCFDGSEISLLMIQQALSLSSDGKIAVQLKNAKLSKKDSFILDFCKNNKNIEKLLKTNVIPEATNIYGIDILFHTVSINPHTYNILYLSNLFDNILKHSSVYDMFSKFDEIWVADQDVANILKKLGIQKNIFIAYPNVMVDGNNQQNIKNNIICNFPKYAMPDWEVFFRAYLQTKKFSNHSLTIISDIFVGEKTKYDYFVDIIKKIKTEYKISSNEYKVELIFNQTPNNINRCIIKSDLLILPFYGQNGWSLLGSQAASMFKSIILTSKSSMTKHIYNCNIISDLPNDMAVNSNQAIDMWKIFLNDVDINKKSFIVHNKNDFINICNNRLKVVKR